VRLIFPALIPTTPLSTIDILRIPATTIFLPNFVFLAHLHFLCTRPPILLKPFPPFLSYALIDEMHTCLFFQSPPTGCPKKRKQRPQSFFFFFFFFFWDTHPQYINLVSLFFFSNLLTFTSNLKKREAEAHQILHLSFFIFFVLCV